MISVWMSAPDLPGVPGVEAERLETELLDFAA